MKVPKAGSDQPTAGASFRQLLEDLNIHVSDLEELETAFTHRSYAPAGKNYERLEFLGDAILSVIVSSHLYSQLPAADEGSLTKMRAIIIREESLASAARRLGYKTLLRVPKGSELGRGEGRDSVLADCFEAVLASVYLGCGYAKARDFTLQALSPEIEGALAGALGADYKTTLQELMQIRGGATPTYRIVSEEGPDHNKSFVAEVWHAGRVLGTGIGSTKQKAEQLAARDALGAQRDGRKR